MAEFGRAIRFCAVVILLAGFTAGGAAGGSGDATRMTRVVHGYRITLAVQTDYGPPHPGADPKHAADLTHRISLSVRDAATGRPVDLSTAAIDVAELGYRGEQIAMKSASPGAICEYESSVRLARKAAYRILAHITPAGGGRTFEARYEYRHQQ